MQQFDLLTAQESDRRVRLRFPSEDFAGLLRVRVGYVDSHASYVDLNRAEALAVARGLEALAQGMDEAD